MEKITKTKLDQFFYLLLAVSTFILTHAYNGIRHDGILYMGQALLELHSNLKLDPFFVFGSQNNYTIFSPFYAFFIKLFGLNFASIFLLLIAQSAFFTSVFLLIKKFTNFDFAFFGIIVLSIANPFYGGYGIFSYGEPFLTARSFAEPLSLFALYFGLDNKWFLAFGLGFLAGLIHPLVALPAVFILWFLFSKQYKSGYIALVLGIIFIVIGAYLGIHPFNKLFLTYDNAWWHLVNIHNPFCILSKWRNGNWFCLIVNFFIAVAGIFYVENKKLKDLFKSIVVACVVFFSLAQIGDMTRNVLAVSLQLWRISWVLQLIDMAFLPYLTYKMWTKNYVGKILTIIFISILLNQIENDYTTFFEAFLLAITILIFYKTNLNFDENIKRLFERKNFTWLFTLTILVLCERFIWLYEISFYPIDFQFNLLVMERCAYFTLAMVLFYAFAKGIRIDEKLLYIVSASSIVALAVSFFGIDFSSFNYFLGFNANPYMLNRAFVLFIIGILFILILRLKALGYVLIFSLFVLSILLWDQRGKWDLYIETHTTNNPFYKYIPEDSSVYFNGQLKYVWILFDRPCFYSRQQCSGDLFNRKSAFLIEKRLNLVKNNKKDILNLCFADKNLGFIVSQTKLIYKPVAIWHTGIKDGFDNLYLYDCKTLRN
ncbi:hypothetical protein [Desulfurella sp.]|uniref:hypothetical protein n=1 Tax=Desulfurella sp. TaxID=1962857 RepID=UPI0025BECC63|nr:hypothetical protein [Desulfurella sp.]